MIAFYLLSFGIAGILLWIPYAEFAYGNGVHIKIAVFCILAGGTVLWSIVPRIDRFPPPGPPLRKDEQPRLFAVIEEVAGRTGQAMPSEAYLIPDVNAWVAQRGGVMGIGSRRVMGIGLPLLQALTTDEFRAVMAHEFGHFYAGDTRLGPWVYKTHAAIGRTIQALESDDSIGFQLVQAPFRAYGAMFLRVTQAVSRAQEHAADRLSARVVGARHLASGLKSIHAAAGVFGGFWSMEIAPLLSIGVVPPLGDGFRRFLAVDRVEAAIKSFLASALEKSESNPLDTHPALRLRLEAIGESAEPALAPSGPKAAALLDDEAGLESRLLVFLYGEKVSQFTRIPWEGMGPRVYHHYVEPMAATASLELRGVTPASLPEIATRLIVRQDRLVRLEPGETYLADQGVNAIGYLGAALTVAAIQAGGEIVSLPGRLILVRVSGEEIDFYDEFAKLRSGGADRDRWDRIVTKAGIAGVELGRLQVSSPQGSADR